MQMIDLTKLIEITASGYLPQFMGGTVRYCNTHFYVTIGSLPQMYTNQYYRTDSRSTIHPFKVAYIKTTG